jgi:hypothetical protein
MPLQEIQHKTIYPLAKFNEEHMAAPVKEMKFRVGNAFGQ